MVVRVEGHNLDLVVTEALNDKPKLQVPSIRLEPAAGLARGSEAIADHAVPIPNSRVRWVKEDVLEFDVDAALGLAAGAWDVVVTTPTGRTARKKAALLVAGRPQIGGLEPPDVCHELQDAPFQIKGEGFLVVRGEGPGVEVGAELAATVTPVDCVPLSGDVVGEVCTGLDIEADASVQPLGPIDLVVTNPEPAACASRTQAQVNVRPPPQVFAVEPDAICAGGGTLTITGSDFALGAEVDVGTPAQSVQLVDDTTLIVEVADASVGLNDVSVTTWGCTATLEDGLRVVSDPLVFFVDPPVVYGAIDTDITAYVSDVVGEITDVWVTEDATGDRTNLSWTWDVADAGVIRATLPTGLADGTYTVHVLEDAVCAGELTGGVTVESTPTVAIEAVDPPFSWTFNFTAVDITATNPIPGGMVGFLETPTVYVIGPDAQTDATKLIGVSWKSETLLNAVVPELPVGFYDVLLVNPDGTIGLLPDGLQSTFDPPPTIDAVGPASLSNQSNEVVEIVGRDFRDPTVAVECREPTGLVTVLPVTVNSWAYGSIDGVIPTNGFSNGSICVVAVTNADGSSARWAAISITNPSSNPFDWQTASNMNEARRAPAGASGRTTAVNRFVYAIGGDDGDPANAKVSIEAAPVGVYGDLGDWEILPGQLPDPRTLAVSAVIGPFVYVVGGNDGTGPVDTVLRARILDPLDVPYFETLSVLPGRNGRGLRGGAWTYRVAALFDPTDLWNPGGESLPSEPIQVTLPQVPGKLRPTLEWKSVHLATGYRIYRSPVADAGPGTEEWLADVAGRTSYTDQGDATNGNKRPLPVGSLGNWAVLQPMSTPRESPCVAVAPDPFPDPEKVYLYVGGGHDGSAAVDSIEWLDITIVTEDEHVSAGWKTSINTFEVGRYQCAGYAVDGKHHSVVELGESWVYFAAGLTAASQESKTIEAGLVADKGELVNWQKLPSNESLSPARAGMGYASASDFLYMFGGQNGWSGSSSTAALDGTAMPHVINWNATGTQLSEARYLPGSAQESAVIFVIGGINANGPLNSVDFTNF